MSVESKYREILVEGIFEAEVVTDMLIVKRNDRCALSYLVLVKNAHCLLTSSLVHRSHVVSNRLSS